MLTLNLPESKSALLFAETWAHNLLAQTHDLPRYSHTKIMLDEMQQSLAKSMKMVDRNKLPEYFEKALEITLARVSQKVMRQEFRFPVSIGLKRVDIHYDLYPKNLPTLIMLYGKDDVPRRCPLTGKWEGRFIYSFMSSESYKIFDRNG